MHFQTRGSRKIDGEPHTPEKITFKYLKYSVGDMSKQVERRRGAKYIVSPFQILINDGNYWFFFHAGASRRHCCFSCLDCFFFGFQFVAKGIGGFFLVHLLAIHAPCK